MPVLLNSHFHFPALGYHSSAKMYPKRENGYLDLQPLLQPVKVRDVWARVRGKAISLPRHANDERKYVLIKAKFLANFYNLPGKEGLEFIKKVLKGARSAEIALRELEFAYEQKTLHKMLQSKELLDLPEIFSEEELFIKTSNALHQGITPGFFLISNKEATATEYYTNAQGEPSKRDYEFLKPLEKGAKHTIHLAWDKDGKKFTAIRTYTQDNPKRYAYLLKKEERIQKKLTYIHAKAIQNLKKEYIELFEKPGHLLSLATTLAPPCSLRDLAAKGDLRKNRAFFQQHPKMLIEPILKQLAVYLKSDVALGDVKPANINIYQKSDNTFLPRYIDLDGSLQLDFGLENILNAWDKLKIALASKEKLQIALDYVFDFKKRGAKPYFSQDVLELCENLKQAIVKSVDIETTYYFTFDDNEEKYLQFSYENMAFLKQKLIELFEAYPHINPQNEKALLRQALSQVIKRVQLLDIQSTGYLLAETLLSSNDSLFTPALAKEYARKSDSPNFLLQELIASQNSLDDSKKLDFNTLVLIVEMINGTVTPSHAHWQEIFSQMLENTL